MSKPLLCIDFDGCLHSYTSGWTHVGNIPDPPVPGAMQFIHDASEHFTIVIYSARSSRKLGRNAMRKWLTEHFRAHCAAHRLPCTDQLARIGWPMNKPAAFLTIDDRALTFTGTWPSIESLQAFRPWNKQ